MPVEYTVSVYDSSNALQAIVTDFVSVNIAKVVNGYDTLELVVPYSSPTKPYLTMDSYIVVKRQDTTLGITEYVEFSGVIQLTQLIYNTVKRWRIVAFGWESLLARRIVAYNEDKLNYTAWQNVAATTIMNDLVATNTTSESITTGNQGRAVSGLIYDFYVDTSSDGQGTLLHVSDVSYANLLSAVQDIALRGNSQFEVVWNVLDGGTGWTFKSASPLLSSSTDRSADVVFSVDNGTLANLTVTTDYTTYGSTAIVRGLGAQNATFRVSRPSIVPTDLASRELFVEASSLGNNTNDLNAAGDAKLAESIKKTVSITTEVQQSISNLYGRDYFIGDLVSVDTLSGIEVVQVNQVRLSMASNGVETKGVQLEFPN
jgi:hypothetical protein